MLPCKWILTSLQGEVLRIIGNLRDISEFYLTGGTALAEFYLGHRLSFDLDLFTTKEGLIAPFSYQEPYRKQFKEFALKILDKIAGGKDV